MGLIEVNYRVTARLNLSCSLKNLQSAIGYYSCTKRS